MLFNTSFTTTGKPTHHLAGQEKVIESSLLNLKNLILIFLPMEKNKFYPQKMYVWNPSNQDAEAGVQGQPGFGGVFWCFMGFLLGGKETGNTGVSLCSPDYPGWPQTHRELSASASKCTCMHMIHTNNEMVTKKIIQTEKTGYMKILSCEAQREPLKCHSASPLLYLLSSLTSYRAAIGNLYTLDKPMSYIPPSPKRPFWALLLLTIISFYFFKGFIHFLWECLHVCQVSAWCLQRSFRYSGNGVIHGCELQCGYLESNPGPLQKHVLLTTESSLLPL